MKEKKKKGGSVGAFFLVIALALVLAGLAGFFYASQKNKPKDLADVGKNEAVDLLEESKRAHHALDEVLMQRAETWQLQDSNRKEFTEKSLPQERKSIIRVGRSTSACRRRQT